MTVIVGIPYEGTVHLGSDSLASCSETGSGSVLAEPKVWVQGGIAIGTTGSGREAQIIEHRLTLPALREDADVMRWLVVEFVDVLRQARKDSGLDSKWPSGVEHGPRAFIGVDGRLFMLDSDYQVIEKPDGGAIGSGAAVALGSLHTSRAFWKSPRKRIEAALAAACAQNIFCAPPFTLVSA